MSSSTRLSFALTALLILMLSADAVQAAGPLARCRACAVAEDRCAGTCFARENKSEMKACLIGCSNAAAFCTCDEPVTLNSEDYVARFGLEGVNDLKDACHATTACGPSYGSCAGWSSYSSCGDPFCGMSFACQECDEWGQCVIGAPAMRYPRERYRVCFNEQGQPCTEYQYSSTASGCYSC